MEFKRIWLDGEKIKLQFWDAWGLQRDWSSEGTIIAKDYCPEYMGFLIVYDITNEYSFNHIKSWIKNIEEFADPNVEIIILGNKSDLNDQREVIIFVKRACFLNNFTQIWRNLFL